MERHSFSAETPFHWRLRSQLCVEQPPIPSHPQFILHSSLDMLLLPVPCVRKPRIRLFSCGKDREFLGWCQDWPCDGSIHGQHGKHVGKGWPEHACEMSTQSHCPEIPPRDQPKAWHNRSSAAGTQDFTHSLFSEPNPGLEMQSNRKGGTRERLDLMGSWEKLE